LTACQHNAIRATDSTSLKRSMAFIQAYRSPSAITMLKAIRDSLPPGPLHDIVALRIDCYVPPTPPGTEPMSVSIDSLISFKHQVAALGWIGDQSFVDELDSGLTNARTFLLQHDTNNCYRQLKSFQDEVDSIYRDSLNSHNRYVKKEGRQFLYFGALWLTVDLLEPPPQFKLTLNTIGEGVVSSNPITALYDSAAIVQLTASPSSGYSFSGWSGDASGSTNPLSVVMNGNKSITATFTQTSFTITASHGSNGSISPAGDNAVNYGDSLRFVITPDPGYHVSDVYIDSMTSVGPVTSYTFPSVTANHTIDAFFVKQKK